MTAPIDPVKLAQEIAKSKQHTEQNWPALLDIFAQVAQGKKARFDAYVKAGFTVEQALTIVASEK